jgi:hypothetical protein
MAYLLLRDIPKEQVQLDVLAFNVEGGFRGFQNLLAGYHRVAVKDGDKSWSAEVVVDDVTILGFDNGLRAAPDEEFAGLARSGAMAPKLIDPNAQHAAVLAAWSIATRRLRGPWREVTIPSLEGASRIRAFLTPGEEAASAGLQASFAALVDGAPDALTRLQKIVEAHFNGGRAIGEHPAYFVEVANLLAAFRKLVPNLDMLSWNNASYFFDDVSELSPEGADAITRLRAP